jgi:iodothyronine deiodinase-like protein
LIKELPVNRYIFSSILFALLLVCNTATAKKIKPNLAIGYSLEESNVYTLDGKKRGLSNLWRDKPLLLITGSLSCPPTRKSVGGSHRLQAEFGDRMNVAVLYVIDAHPKGDISPYSGEEWVPKENFKEDVLIRQPVSQQQRTKRAKELDQLLGIKVPVLIDNMDNVNWKQLGRLPNAAIFIDTNGKVIAKQKWFNADKMKKKLTKYFAK